MGQKIGRREFMTAAVPLGVGLAMAADLATKPMSEVRLGFIGVGGRGSALVQQFLSVKGCRVVAICDIRPERVARMQRAAETAGQPTPAAYDRGETDYLRMCDRNDVDLVGIATPWNLHAPMSVAALNRGKHVGVETPPAQTVVECWQMLEAAEKAGRHCMLLENYCYTREVMCVLNMVRQGLFGEPMHVYAGYQKEALYYSFNADGSLTFAGEGSGKSRGNWYPCHFAGPSAHWMDVNRGDYFDYLVTMGTYAYSYNHYAKEILGPNNPYATKKFDMADISNTMIRTKNGRSLHLITDQKLPRPYRHIYHLMGTNGIFENEDARVHIQGRSPGEWTVAGKRQVAREFEPLSNYYKEFEHPLWRDLGARAKTSGHGGGDFLCCYRVIEALITGTYPDVDVYDTVLWSSIVELSEISARNRSKVMDFPDFTRGLWKTRKPLPIRGMTI
jgi:predicted dehydrogenase